MGKKVSQSFVIKATTAALTAVATAFGVTGVAAADASISNTGYGSNNVISYGGGGGYGSGSNGYHDYAQFWQANKNYQQHDWNWDWKQHKDWNHDQHCQPWQTGYQVVWHAPTYNNNNWGNGGSNDWGQNDDHDNWGGNGGYGGGGGSTTYRSSDRETVKVNNDNDVRVTNNVTQTAYSGDATSSYNTHGGSVSTGDASNYSSNVTTVAIDNTSSVPDWSSGSDSWGGPGYVVRDTGYGSRNLVDVSSVRSYEVNNDNNIRVTNNVRQTAASGDATSRGNTWGGSVNTGDASNWQSSDTWVRIEN